MSEILYMSLCTTLYTTLVDTTVEAIAVTDEAAEAADFSDTLASSDKVEALRERLFLVLGSGLPDLFDIFLFLFSMPVMTGD